MFGISDFINIDALMEAGGRWERSLPFNHVVIDDFFDKDFATHLENEFPSADDDIWNVYSNSVEKKKACNNWNRFPEKTYRAFEYLNSEHFLSLLRKSLLGGGELSADPGLNGGGWHIHGRGDMLNTHLDYSLHPKLMLERKLNLIVYLNSNWQEDWGGQLGLWSNDRNSEPGELVVAIPPLFNRAIIFDTTQNSWHGLPDPIDCPQGQTRKSIAVYYMRQPDKSAGVRSKALFAPRPEQKKDYKVLDLIKKRSSAITASDVFISEE